MLQKQLARLYLTGMALQYTQLLAADIYSKNEYAAVLLFMWVYVVKQQSNERHAIQIKFKEGPTF